MVLCLSQKPAGGFIYLFILNIYPAALTPRTSNTLIVQYYFDAGGFDSKGGTLSTKIQSVHAVCVPTFNMTYLERVITTQESTDDRKGSVTLTSLLIRDSNTQ